MEEEIIPLPLQISVHETICVSEWLIIGIILDRFTTLELLKGKTLVSVAEYRAILGDNSSTDKHIVERLQYLEAFCRNIIKPELQIYEQHKPNSR